MSLAAVIVLATGFRADGGGPVAIAPLGGLPALAHTLRSVAGVRRLRDPQHQIYVVVNDSDMPLFVGPKGVLSSLPVDVMLPSSQIISNGCASSEQWNGEVFDLQVALRTITSEPGVADLQGHILALSHTLTFGPGYSLQRLVEHAMLRAKDVVGYSTLTPADLSLLGGDGHTVVLPADTVPLPPLRALVPQSSCYEGDDVAEPLLVLRATSIPFVMASSEADLAGLAAEILNAPGGDGLCGVDLQAGRLRLLSPATLEHAHKYVEYLTTNPAALLSTEAPYSTLGAATAPQLLHATQKFSAGYFGEDTTGKSSPTGKYYSLPSTFYMTQTRRQYATIMR